MITTGSNNCDYNFGTFDDFGVKKSPKSIHITWYWCQDICQDTVTWWKKGQNKSGKAPPIRAMPESLFAKVSSPAVLCQFADYSYFHFPVDCSFVSMVSSQFISTVWCLDHTNHIFSESLSSGDDNDRDEYLHKDLYKDKDTHIQTKTNTKCFQDPMYAIFIKINGFKDLEYCESQQSSVD